MLRRTFLQTAAATAMIGSLKMNLPAFAAEGASDPMLDVWTGAHGGFPPFDKITADLIKPALMKGMDLNRAEIEAIAANPEAPNFENTLAAMENAGRAMDRASTIYNIYTSVLNDKQMQAVEAEMSPVLSAFYDDITQNDALFQRIKAVYEARESAGLTDEQKRLAETVYKKIGRAHV